jgi:hypothetical protein
VVEALHASSGDRFMKGESMKRIFLFLIVAAAFIFVIGCKSEQVREETLGTDTKKETSEWEPVIK